MTPFALPSDFKIVINPRPEMPRDVSEVLMFIIGFAIGFTIATVFPLYR